MKPRVVVTRRIPDDGIAVLRSHFDVDENRDDRPYTPAELAARAREADALVALLTDRIDEALLAQCPRLKVVANVAVGFAWRFSVYGAAIAARTVLLLLAATCATVASTAG